MSLARSQTCHSSIFVKTRGCPELAKFCLSGCECWHVLLSKGKGDPPHLWYKGHLPVCSLLISPKTFSYMARLSFRHSRRPPALEKSAAPAESSSCTRSSRTPLPTCSMPPAAVPACWEAQMSVLLSIAPAALDKSDQDHPFSKKFSPWDRLQLGACISDVSAALMPFSPSFVAAEIRAESSADYLSRGPAFPLLFQSRTSSPLFLGKDFSTVQMQLFPLEVISRRYDGLLKIRCTMRAAWPETWPSGSIYGDYRDPLSQRSILLSACKFSKKMWNWPQLWSSTELRARTSWNLTQTL